MWPKLDDNKKLLGSRASSLTNNLNKVSNLDMLNWHRQIGKVVARRMLDSISNNKKSQDLLEKVSKQLYNAKVVLRTRANIIKELEDRIFKQSRKPKDGISLKKLLEEKTNIKILREIANILDYDERTLIVAFKRKEEIENQLQTMQKYLKLKDCERKG